MIRICKDFGHRPGNSALAHVACDCFCERCFFARVFALTIGGVDVITL